jgi:hypothetical protein
VRKPLGLHTTPKPIAFQELMHEREAASHEHAGALMSREQLLFLSEL